MDELLNSSAVKLRQMIANREISARELLGCHLSHIQRLNPSVNAIVTLTAEAAEKRAMALDEMQASGQELGVLHGLPMAHKDLTMTKGIRTTFGSPIYAEHIPQRDELLIERLKHAGLRGQRDRIDNHAALGPFDSIDLGGLRRNIKVLVDNANSA